MKKILFSFSPLPLSPHFKIIFQEGINIPSTVCHQSTFPQVPVFLGIKLPNKM